MDRRLSRYSLRMAINTASTGTALRNTQSTSLTLWLATPYCSISSFSSYPIVSSFVILLLKPSFFFLLVLGKQRKTKNKVDNLKYRVRNIFVFQYVNTVIVVLLAFNSLPLPANVSSTLFAGDLKFVKGVFKDFDVRWYAQVGSVIVATQIAMIFVPHFFVLVGELKRFCRRCKDRKYSCDSKKTVQVIQSKYEEIYMGGEFYIQFRLAHILTSVFVTLTFSSGLPLLYLVLYVNLVAVYWLDKYMILRVYQKPQIFTLELTKSVISSIKWALLVHILFSFFMYTTPNILSSAPLENAPQPAESEETSGDTTEYLERFSKSSLSHLHVTISAFASPALILVLCLEELLIGAMHSISKSCRRCCKSRKVKTGPK